MDNTPKFDRPLTKQETEVEALVEVILRDSDDAVLACEQALSALPNPDPAFVRWLSDDSLKVDMGKVVRTGA